MTMARGQLVDSTVTPYYHCISRCVRRAFLCGEGCEHRKQWVEDRLKELASIFAIEVCAYAVLDNHLHVVLRLNDQAAAGWSNEETVRRWGKLFPPRGKDRQTLKVTEAWVEDRLKDAKWIVECRKRLNDLGWFMKCIKEPLARMANREDECRGTFWEARFKSIAILDEEALLTTLAYVDMNVMAAGMAKTPEESAHTSVKARVEHCRETGRLEGLVAAKAGSRALAAAPSSGLSATFSPGAGEKGQIVGAAEEKAKLVEDEAFWMVPIQDRRDARGSSRVGDTGYDAAGQRAGLSPHMSLASYLQLLDWSSRLFRPGKARVPKEAADILSRLGSSPDLWHQRLKKLRETDRLIGVVFATARTSITRFAESRRMSRVANTAGMKDC